MEKIVLRPTTWKTILSLIANIAMLAMGIYLVYSLHNNFGWLTILLFGTTLILNIIQLIPTNNQLVVQPEGISIRTMFWKSEIQWKNIEKFYTKKIFFQNITLIRFSPQYTGKYLAYKVDTLAANNEGTLPSNYGKKAEELCRFLNDKLEKYKTLSS